MRTYVDGNSARFTYDSFCTVNAELYTGEKFTSLEPRRLFPTSGPQEMISLLDRDGKEQMIIRSIASLDPDSAKVIKDALGDYYRIPVITEIHSTKVSNWLIQFQVTTDRGDTNIMVKSVFSDIKLLFEKRVLIKDASDNRYEIPDLYALDPKSMKIIDAFL